MADAAAAAAAGGAAVRGEGALRERLRDAAVPALLSLAQQQESLGLAALPPSLTATLLDVVQQREAAGTAADAVLLEKGVMRLGDTALARRGLLPGSAADWARCAATALALHQVAAASPNPPEPHETFLKLPIRAGDGGGALRRVLRGAVTRLPGVGAVAAACHVSLAEHADVARRLVAPSAAGPWLLFAVANGVRVEALGAPAGDAALGPARSAGLRPGRCLLLDERVREVLVYGAAAATAYVTVARGDAAEAEAAGLLLRVAEQRVEELSDAARRRVLTTVGASLPPPPQGTLLPPAPAEPPRDGVRQQPGGGEQAMGWGQPPGGWGQPPA
eukprot:gene866-10059_t